MSGPETDPLPDLIRRSAAGDQGAFQALYDAVSSRVFGLALKICRRHDLAEEATLDTFLQVWKDAVSYDAARGSALGWIVTIARSRAIDHLRSRSTHHREQDLAAAASQTMPDPDPEVARQGSERDDIVRRALSALPREQRVAIEAAYFSGLSHAEVALASNVPLGTVKTRIRAGMSTLRRRLSGVKGCLS